MPRSTCRQRIEEVRSSSESPVRRTRRRVDSSPQSPAQRRAASPPRTQNEQTPRAVEQPAAVTTLSVEDIREAVAAELARAQTDTAGVAGNANSAARRRGRGQARGWGRGRWINFGCYLPHPGPYTPFCRAHREPGCTICIFFCPNQNYMNPQENNWAVEN